MPGMDADETYLSDGLVFAWNHGGAYIDVFRNIYAAPFASINVWDYSKGVCTINSRMEFIGECEEWLTYNDEEPFDYASGELDECWD